MPERPPRKLFNPIMLTEGNSKDNFCLSFIEHRQDGSRYLLKTYVPKDFIEGMVSMHGVGAWQDTFRETRISDPEMGTNIMICPPLPEPAT